MKTGINTISPNPAPPGATVEIEGIGFEHMDKLFFGDQEVPFEVINDTRLRTRVPDGAGPVQVTVKWEKGPIPLSSGRSFAIDPPR